MRHNEREREEAKKQREMEYEARKEAYRFVFRTQQGKVVLDDILKKAMLWVTTFTGNSQTYFNEGKRDLGLYILKMTNTADPNIIIQLMSEKLELKLRQDGKDE